MVRNYSKRNSWVATVLAMAAGLMPPAWSQDGTTVQDEAQRARESQRLMREIEMLQRYQFGSHRGYWNALEAKLRDTKRRSRELGEDALVAVLTMTGTSLDASILACRGLRLVGRSNPDPDSFSSVELLVSLIRDPRLSAEACMALQQKESSKINPALRAALPLVENALKEDIIATLARRRDQEAVPVIESVAKGIDDVGVRFMAIRGLGQIGGEKAIEALVGFRLGDSYANAREHAVLSAAVRALKLSSNDEKTGRSTLRRLVQNSPLKPVRLGALYELAQHDVDQRAALCRQALSSGKGDLLEIVPQVFALLKTEDIRALYGSFFDGLSVEAQTLLVGLWPPDDRELDKMRALSVNPELDPALRRAAQRAVDRLEN